MPRLRRYRAGETKHDLWQRARERVENHFLYITLTWQVYGRSEDGERPRHIREVRDIHVLINRRTGRRIAVRNEDWYPKRWEKYLQLAKHIPLEYSITEKQLPLVLDEEHRVIFASGGQRGGKTEASALWSVRQWALKGGAGVTAFWIAPEQQLTQIVVEKLVTGEDDRPPLLPPGLITYYPKTPWSKPQHLVWVDGTRQLLAHASERGLGKNIKGRGPRWINVDEACEIKPIEPWRIIRGRVNQRGGHKGQIFLSSTPVAGHWAHSEIVLAVDAGNKPTYTYDHLSMVDNPWIPLSEVDEAIADAGGPEDPVCQREVFGLWRPDGTALWYAFDALKHVRHFRTLEDLGLVDRTATMVHRYFPNSTVERDHCAGQDFNRNPMTTEVVKVGIPKALLDQCKSRDELRAVDVPENYCFVVVGEVVTQNIGVKMHGHAILEHGWGALPIACDPSGAQPGHRIDGKRGDKESTTDAQDLTLAGHDVRACHRSFSGEPYAPPQLDSLKLVHKLMSEERAGIPRWVQHAKCRALFQSMTQQQATARGGIYKPPSTKHDKLSSATDAARYAAWKLFHHELSKPATVQVGA